MIKLNVNGDYVLLLVNNSEQEELHKDTDDVEYNRYSDGKVSLKFGRRTFEMVSPTDFEIAGSAVTDADDFVTKLEAVFTRYSSGGGGGSSYLVYTALLSQSGTDAPVATVLQNTLGGTVVWTRNVPGSYRATLSNAFTQNKTYFPPFGDFAGDWTPMIGVYDSGGTGALIGFYFMYWVSASQLYLETYNGSGTQVEFSTLFGATKISLPEIRVYP